MKACGKCNRYLSYDSFYNQCNTKDKKSNYCKECKSECFKERTERLKRNDLAKYLLEKSCEAAFERGKSTYTRAGYENVRCSFDNVRSFFEAFWVDDIFRHEWIVQTDVYVANNCIYKYRPTLDRIDPERGYEKGNIRVLPQWINASKGYSKLAN
ncbi:hypothetical protein [Paenibacillus sp. FSL R7-277]|uniref:hypothetical protein n=1 Tax=Paenibacillus sp. FSL R7-277 TaxID=1227352 RepID=UPI0005644247|nr:hypothetical protein [Paenibacillus sp. FSL R7-277]